MKFHDAVANEAVNSLTVLRPPRSATKVVNSGNDVLGAPIQNAVAASFVNSSGNLRPPRPAMDDVNSIS